MRSVFFVSTVWFRHYNHIFKSSTGLYVFISLRGGNAHIHTKYAPKQFYPIHHRVTTYLHRSPSSLANFSFWDFALEAPLVIIPTSRGLAHDHCNTKEITIFPCINLIELYHYTKNRYIQGTKQVIDMIDNINIYPTMMSILMSASPLHCCKYT